MSRVMHCWAGLLALCLLACAEPGKPPADTASSGAVKAFVRVEGTRFYMGDKPYRFVGANMWYGAYLGSPGETGDRDRLLRELDLLRERGITNLRVLAVSEASELMRSVSPAILQNPEGNLNEELLQGLDFLLAAMAERDMKAVLYLNNFWQWSGGMSQYVAWFTDTPVLDPDVTGEWNAFMENSARFYRIEEAQQLYREVIRKLINRTNTVTGIPYHSDPTIMSWQLANEPRPGSDAHGRPFYPQFETWIHETAGYIKSLAPRQLVSTGNEGAMGTLGDAGLFEKSHRSDNVDYLTFHMWIKNWGWFDVTRAEETFDSAMEKAGNYMDTHMAIAGRLNKPITLEEFGAERDGGVFEPGTPVTYRDRYYRLVFDYIERNAAAGGPFAGSNIWAWGGFAETDREDTMWQPGEDFFGDPPQEPQGLNSVFASDTSTLDIMQEHARNLETIQ